jgi:DNA-binding NtrC family response regulator
MNLAPIDEAATNPLSDEMWRGTQVRATLRFVSPTAQILALDGIKILLGRETGCDVVLEGGAVSRRHAAILRRAGGHAIRDEGSRNGVFVNGRRIEKEAPLTLGDVVRLGDHVAIVGERLGAPQPVFHEMAAGLWGGHVLERSVRLATRAGRGTASVLVLGESGTGKERFAGLIHLHSGRKGPLVAINCAALSESLLESELFGHQRSAFTGAQHSREGLVRSAHQGTLLLDEVGELSPRAQSLLLRVVQESEVLPVGALRPVSVDVRFIGATHRDLDRCVEQGHFRADLLYRLSGVRVRVPPLRERREDVLALFTLFVQRAMGRTPELGPLLIEALCLHNWPGNVREVQQLAEGMATFYSDLARWRFEHLPEELRGVLVHLSGLGGQAPSRQEQANEERASQEPALEPPSTRRRPRQLSGAAVGEALAVASGNVAQAARQLGIARQSLYVLIRQHGIDPASYR